MEHVTAKLDRFERFACRVLDQHRSTQRKVARAADDEAALTAAIVDWARQYGRYSDRRVTALLRTEGWHCKHKRVERIWGCVRLRPERANHVWAE